MPTRKRSFNSNSKVDVEPPAKAFSYTYKPTPNERTLLPRQTKEQRIAELRRMKLSKFIRINIGTADDDPTGQRVEYFARFSNDFHEDLGGMVILLPMKTNPKLFATAIKKLVSIAEDPDPKTWKDFLRVPHGFSILAGMEREKKWKRFRRRKKVRQRDDAPSTWPADRLDAAAKGVKAMASLAFLTAPKEFRERFYLGNAKESRDARTLAEDMRRGLEKEAAKR